MYYSDIKQALKDSFKQVFTCYKDKQTGYEIWLTKWRDNKRFLQVKKSLITQMNLWCGLLHHI